MIVSVRGVLEAAGPDWVHLRVGGVTLQVFVPASTAARVGGAGSEVSLHTHLRVQNEQPVLYGFADAASLNLFGLLTGVSGVGPRLGLSLLSALEPARLQMAVVSGDVAALSSASGVGRRTASRIILDLKGKVDLGGEIVPGGLGRRRRRGHHRIIGVGLLSSRSQGRSRQLAAGRRIERGRPDTFGPSDVRLPRLRV